MKRIRLRTFGNLWITSWLYEELIKKEGCFDVTLDIGLSRERVCVQNNRLYTARASYPLRLEDIKPSREDRVVAVDENGEIREAVAITEHGYYKLKAIAPDRAPTLEINGIHMHRIAEVDPWQDSLLKILDARVKRGDVVLDTCMGLGYTSIISTMRGAESVYTYEVDENVIAIAGMNPWSRGLLNEKITIHNENVVESIEGLPSNYFNKVIHDPPRLTKEYGDLYSIEFYREMYRILKPGGILYHYTGLQGGHGRANIVGNVGSRLKKAGFQEVRFSERSLGFIARKVI